MEERLAEEAAVHRARGTIFSVVLADVDRFKQINDEHGHDAGDRALSGVAKVFQATLRAGDAVARWGGEEFLLLLPGTDVKAAEEVALRLRAAAEQRLAELGGLPGALTLTFGSRPAVEEPASAFKSGRHVRRSSPSAGNPRESEAKPCRFDISADCYCPSA